MCNYNRPPRFARTRAVVGQIAGPVQYSELVKALPAPKGQPWAQQHHWGESNKAYSAFLMYRDQPPDQRTLRVAADRYRESLNLKGTVGPLNRVRNWSAQFKWVDRSRAFDAHMDAAEVEAIRRRRKESAKRHAEQAYEVQEAMMRPIQVFRERLLDTLQGKRSDDLQELSDDELIRLGRSTASILFEAQKQEMESLQTASSGEADMSETITLRGDILRRVLSDPGKIATLESVQFEVTEETRRAENLGNESSGEPDLREENKGTGSQGRLIQGEESGGTDPQGAGSQGAA